MMSLPRRCLTSRNRLFLHSLYRNFRRSRIQGVEILRRASAEEINTLVEIIRNLLVGNYKNKRCIKYKHLLRKLASGRVSVKTKQNILIRNQRGGALITALLAPLIGALLSSLI
jgi:hypothetical protein